MPFAENALGTKPMTNFKSCVEFERSRMTLR